MDLFASLNKIKPPEQKPPEEEFDPQWMDPNQQFMPGGGLPPLSAYAPPSSSFNERMAEIAVGASLTIAGKPVGNIDELPTLFYFLTDNWRHLQLTNLKAKDQRYIEREIADIHMLAGQGRRKLLCKLKQIELFNSIYLFKSRSDLDDMRERKIWTLQTSQFQNQEIKRPKESGGGFINFFTGNKGGGM